MKLSPNIVLFSIFTLITTLATTGCFSVGASNGATMTAENPSPTQLSKFDANIYPLNKVVCDPFDPNPPGTNDGLAATLYYRTQGQRNFASVQEYIEQAQKSTQNLFFSSLNVPTRIFDLGFPTETGTKVKNDVNEDLNEYFALSFSSVLKLSATDDEGEYELALLSDDGAVFKIKQTDGTFKTVVNNDGQHPTRLGCGSETLIMTHATEILVQLDYYQGPRYHISLIPLWRKVQPSNVPESRCGQNGNSLFFDPDHQSVALPAYEELLGRGWKPLAASNWHLPGTSVFNPCVPGTPPVISNFQLARNEENLLTFTWQTDRPASSQLLAKNIASGVEELSSSDNVLRTSHEVHIYMGNNLEQTFDFSAISISEDYGKAISDPLRETIH